jgi:hypothetical protein
LTISAAALVRIPSLRLANHLLLVLSALHWPEVTFTVLHVVAAATSIPGSGYAVVVQSGQLPMSIWLVASTSTSALAATLRPEVEIDGRATRLSAEQTAAVDRGRLANGNWSSQPD